MTELDLAREVLIALGGICVGSALGRWERRVNANQPARARWFDLARIVMGLLILVAVGVTVVQLQVKSADDRARADCQGEFSTAVAEIIAKRSQATGDSNLQTAERDQELAKLVDAILSGDQRNVEPALRQFRAAIDEQRAATERLEQVRRAEPLPAPPDC